MVRSLTRHPAALPASKYLPAAVLDCHDVVLALQIQPELDPVAEIGAKPHCLSAVMERLPSGIVGNASGGHAEIARPHPFGDHIPASSFLFVFTTAMTYACHLTFDVDWAPDWMVDICRQQLNQKNVKGTFFVTHRSDIIADLLIDGHAVGIHPNLFAGSSQGRSVRAVFDYLLDILPQADMMRTHGLYQSSPFFSEIILNYPQIKTDFSLLTYKSVGVEKTTLLLGEGQIDRVNYNWEDDVAFNDHHWVWRTFQPWSPLHVFDFHPVHVALNSRDDANYRRLKDEIGGRPLYSIDKSSAGKYRNTEYGTESLLLSVLSSEADFISVDRWRPT